MFIVLLRFSANKKSAGDYMDAHKAWIKQGFDEGIFLLVGSIKPGQGGAIVAHGCTLAALQQRINEDPFVTEDVVNAEILDIDTARADDRLQFLLQAA
jgi:uncharacterized protein YciI